MSLGTLILTIFVTIIATALVIIAVILVTNRIEEKQLEQNEKQNSADLQQSTNQNQLNANNSEEMSTQNSTNINQIFDSNNTNEYNQYTEMNLNGKKKIIKLKLINTPNNDEDNIKTQIAINDSSYKEIYEFTSDYIEDALPKIEKIKSQEGKDYIAIINNYNWINNYIKIFDENCNLIGEVEYLGATSFTVENDTKQRYELELDSIYVYNFFSQDEFALYKYTIENDKVVEKVVRTYQENMESGTFISGAS